MDTREAIITKGVGGLYEVRPLSAPRSEVLFCRARGVFRHEKLTPLPGDTVRIQPAGEESDEYVIDEILPRRCALIRPAVANLTHLFVVIPAARPEPDLLTADKLISIAEYCGIESVVVVSKADLAPEKAAEILASYRLAGFEAFGISAVSGEGVPALGTFLSSLGSAEKTAVAAFAGASGAGKSTLLARLFPGMHFATGSVSRKTERGRHTTREVELFPAGDAVMVADTPGFSMLDFTRFNFYPSAALPLTFREFVPFLGKCRYTKCTHTKEEDCAVLAAVARGEISRSRHASYCALFEDFRQKPDWKRRQEGMLNE